MSELLLLLILALIFIFTPDTYIGSKYRLSVYLICNNRYRYRPWKTHIGRPLVFSVTRSFRNRSNMLICCSRSIYDYYRCWKLFLWKLIIHNCILLGIIWFYIYSLGSSSLSFILCTCSFRCKNLLTKGQRWSVVVKLHRFMSSYLGLFSFGPATEMFWF